MVGVCTHAVSTVVPTFWICRNIFCLFGIQLASAFKKNLSTLLIFWHFVSKWQHSQQVHVALKVFSLSLSLSLFCLLQSLSLLWKIYVKIKFLKYYQIFFFFSQCEKESKVQCLLLYCLSVTLAVSPNKAGNTIQGKYSTIKLGE